MRRAAPARGRRAGSRRYAGARIIQLGGTPPIRPEEWLKLTNCGYDAPSEPFVKEMLDQNITASSAPSTSTSAS